MMNAARGNRVPGGALPRSARLASLIAASADKRISESLASGTAPARPIHSAIPAARPTLVMTKRAPRSASDSPERASMFDSADVACSTRLAGFQMTRMAASSRIPAGTAPELAGELRDSRLHLVVFCFRLPPDEPQPGAFDIHVVHRCDVERQELRYEQSADDCKAERPA